MRRDVDVVIAVHDSARPVERAVSSVLRSRVVRRAIVVCHDLDAEPIRERLLLLGLDGRVLVLEHRDGIRSPAGPYNHGLDYADAAYVAVMGSDDSVVDGAIDRWRDTADATGADMVIAPLRHAGGARVPTPPTLRRRGLRASRDRLAYRSAPLGLISRERFGKLRFTDRVATGEDLAYSMRIWFSDAVIVAAPPPAFYEIHDDTERVTFSRRPLREDVRAVQMLINTPEARALPQRDRRALAIKLWRVNLFGAVHYRVGDWDDDDRSVASELARDLSSFSPESIRLLSRSESKLRDALLRPSVPDDVVDELSARRRRFLSVDALMPSDPRTLFDRDAPLRFSAATWWVSRS